MHRVCVNSLWLMAPCRMQSWRAANLWRRWVSMTSLRHRGYSRRRGRKRRRREWISWELGAWGHWTRGRILAHSPVIHWRISWSFQSWVTIHSVASLLFVSVSCCFCINFFVNGHIHDFFCYHAIIMHIHVNLLPMALSGYVYRQTYRLKFDSDEHE